MIGRVRNLSNNASYFYVNVNKPTIDHPTNVEVIKQRAYSSRHVLYKEFSENGLRFEYQRDGSTRVYTSTYFTIWLENVSVRNKSKNDFILQFLTLGVLNGGKFARSTTEDFEEICGYPMFVDGKLADELKQLRLEIATSRDAIALSEATAIANADDIDDDQFLEIKRRFDAQLEVDPAMRAIYDKHKLKKIYNYDGVIDAEFVNKYNDRSVISLFINNNRMIGDTDTALQKIREAEMNLHDAAFLNPEDQPIDINRKYVYNKHRIVTTLMRAVGWDSLDDPKLINVNRFGDGVGEGNGGGVDMKAIIAEAQEVFSISCVDNRTTIESVLKSLYGAKIYKGEVEDTVAIMRTNLFIIKDGNLVIN
jgi:hypothetical protein